MAAALPEEPEADLELAAFPCDVHHRILRYCSDHSAARLSATGKLWRAVYVADGSRVPRWTIIRLLTEWTRGQKVELLGGSEPDDGWEAATIRLHELFVKLASMKSPGCNIQKYLRHLVGAAPSSPPVVCGILGISMLPTSLTNVVCDGDDAVRSHQWTPAVKMAIRVANGPCARSRPGKSVSVDVPRFLCMLEWVTAKQGRLRLLMAEIHQIDCRITEEFLKYPRCIKTAERAAQLDCMARHEFSGCLDRQTLSFSHLVRMAAAAMCEHQDDDTAASQTLSNYGASFAVDGRTGVVQRMDWYPDGKGVQCWA